MPEAQVKGLALSSLIALICKSDSAVVKAVSSKFSLMLQKYIVFFNERRIEINQNFNRKITDIQKNILTETEKSFILHEFDRFKNDRNLSVLTISIDNIDAKLVFFYFCSLFRNILAAGGLVRNQNNEILIIKRFGCWDLPKGKKEKNEKLRTAAFREVEEETGISCSVITKKLPVTYHIYIDKKGREILKTTHWFEMLYTGNQIPVPQTQENIEDVIWLPFLKIDTFYRNTYASLANLLQEYLNKK